MNSFPAAEDTESTSIFSTLLALLWEIEILRNSLGRTIQQLESASWTDVSGQVLQIKLF